MSEVFEVSGASQQSEEPELTDGSSTPGGSAAREVFPWREELPILVAISLGGALGAVLRYGICEGIGHDAAGFGWGTLSVNATGCLLIGILMGVIERVGARPWVRPFLGVGFLGGFTTFSTYIADVQENLRTGYPITALAYLSLTVVLALACVWFGHLTVHRGLQVRATSTTDLAIDTGAGSAR